MMNPGILNLITGQQQPPVEGLRMPKLRVNPDILRQLQPDKTFVYEEPEQMISTTPPVQTLGLPDITVEGVDKAPPSLVDILTTPPTQVGIGDKQITPTIDKLRLPKFNVVTKETARSGQASGEGNITSSQWTKINNRMCAKGFDFRGAEDTKSIFNRLSETTGGLPKEHQQVLDSVIGNKAQIIQSPVTSKDIIKAKKFFGTTEDFNEAGYMTTDGKFLDFSGKNDGAMGGTRVQDHREINFVLPEKTFKNKDSNSEGMRHFMNAGNIRMQPPGGIDISKRPTDSQKRTLAKYINNNNGELLVDISGENGNVIKSLDFDIGTNPAKILSDIDKEFDLFN